MNEPKKKQSASDLVPGLVAAVAFLGMGWFLGGSWIWLSALLAIAVYFGVRWIMPSATPEETPEISPDERLIQIESLAGEIGNGEVVSITRRIAEKARALLQYSAANPLKSGESLFLVRQYLELTYTGLRLTRESSTLPHDAAEQQITELLESVLTRFSHLYDRLVAEDTAALAGELKALTQTLKELDQVCLTLGGENG